MKESLRLRLDQLVDRFEELNALLADAEVISDNNKFRKLSREHSELQEITDVWQQYKQAEADISTAEEMLAEPDFKEMAQEEIKENKALIEDLESQLNILMIPKDPNDANAAFLEVRAGTGGDEAAIFSGDLFRMYSKYAETQGWRIEILSENEGEHGGYKEVICRVDGDGVYGRLKFESGAHRVQRVPATESQGRVHTSACTVAILPEVDVDTSVDINPADLRIDTYRASGAGGQHINKTSEMRRDLVGSGDRSERIRTYNYPQGRMTDHRINLTLYKLDAIMEGDLTEILDNLHREYQADQLAMLAQENDA